MFEQVASPDTANILVHLIEAYGPTGAAFGGLLAMLLRGLKKAEARNATLEKRISELEGRQLDEHGEMIGEYTVLVRDNSTVISKLTGCLEAIKSTLDRIDRRTEEKS